ncbi:hypothetical protein HKX48_008474 [Thoreauomyces humboldtii]|nr:hypothetical protein HKX48_008474 [Thoreauomyces humboldtii]
MSAFSSSLPAPVNSTGAVMASKFVTATEAETTHAQRIAEAQAEGREYIEPSQTFDPRPLYEKLADKKRIEEEEHAEKLRFSNLVHRLDDDEYAFLASFDDAKTRRDREVARETKEELEGFRKQVAEAPEPPPSLMMGGGADGAGIGIGIGTGTETGHVPTATATKDFQRKALEGLVVVRKRKKVDGKRSAVDVKVEDEDGGGSGSKKARTSGTVRQPWLDPPSSSTVKKEPPIIPSGLGLLAAYSDSDSD